ncbi:MAG TPA: BolA/IbaG family iron-sulfur metabolism protein [Steroidobacteraceae bacterium]|nr:BolA/IbaG family iron-sulfur metabolism protein [Steroidobacteraceae bacterium]
MKPEEIAALIRSQLPSAEARVASPDEVHFEAVVIASEFAGKRTLERHRLVYSALGGRMGREIHALALQVFTPEEWAARP